MHTHDYFVEPHPTRFERLEDALAELMEIKRLSPREIYFLNPIADNISSAWDNKGYAVSNNFCCSNVPNVVLSIDDDSLISDKVLRDVSDELSYIAEVTERISREFNVSPEIGWELVGVGDASDMEICLYIEPSEWTEAKAAFEQYVAMQSDWEYFKLTFDEDIKKVSGVYRNRPEEGFFIKRRKIRKQNRIWDNYFDTLIKDIQPFLRHI